MKRTTITRIIAAVLCIVMVCALAACGQKPAKEEYKPPVDISGMDYDEASAALYEEALGEFNALYKEAKEQTDLSKRFAMMAMAEAKLLESGVFLPLQTQGGNYAITRVAPRTANTTLWGNDTDRYHNVVVATEMIKAAERVEMIAKWNELKGTGEYEQWAKDYLTEKGYTLKDTYTIGYSSDPKTWDAVATSRAADSEAIVNTYDGLYEYDMENVAKPALAESYEVSEDGLTYTFKIREGVAWVDSQGREIGEVTADDFVAGMQHMLDACGGLEYLVQGVIVNADEYINAKVEDFAEVGVKATDKYTLEYTLCAPCSYFTTMLSYNVFAPLNRDYYTSQGGKFGKDFNSEAASYKYGKSPDTIAYCGPYVVTNATSENTIVYQLNEKYWNKDNVTIKTLTWLFNDGQDATKSYNDAKAGVIDGCGLNSAAIESAKKDGLFDEYAYASDTNATTFSSFANINRAAYANEDGKVASEKTEDQKTAAYAAMRNVHFRRALTLAVDRASYNAQSVGEDLKLNSLRNSYTPGNFVTLDAETTVTINGKETTFPAGTYYGEVMQAQLDADQFPVKAWDKEKNTGDGYDGWINIDAAKAELETAIAQLAEQGVTVSAENPIVIDLPGFTGSEVYQNRANAYKQSIETNLEGKVKVNVTECPTADDWYNAGYYTETGADANYDLYDVSGWGPDYGDPQTYLDTMLPDYAGYMTKCLGIF